MNNINKVISNLYNHRFIKIIFPTLVYCLQKELKGCTSVLDLGCGSNSPLQHCNITKSVGVDAYKLSIEKSKKSKIHSKYILSDITKIKFKPKSFDAVIMIDVLEHLNKKKGQEMLINVEKWARKKIIITTPNGFYHQPMVDNNPLQLHKSGWILNEFLKRNYKAYGLAGLKSLRNTSVCNKETEKISLLNSIKLKPKLFWFILSVLSQRITYFFPKFAFEIFYVKNL